MLIRPRGAQAAVARPRPAAGGCRARPSTATVVKMSPEQALHLGRLQGAGAVGLLAQGDDGQQQAARDRPACGPRQRDQRLALPRHVQSGPSAGISHSSLTRRWGRVVKTCLILSRLRAVTGRQGGCACRGRCCSRSTMGTTSTRAILFDARRRALAAASARAEASLSGRRLGRARPGGDPPRRPGGPEGSGGALRRGTRPDMRRVGITNQRETVVVWEKGQRPPDPPRHRVAGPPHRRGLRAP